MWYEQNLEQNFDQNQCQGSSCSLDKKSCTSSGSCASWCAMSYIWLIVFLLVILVIIVAVSVAIMSPMNPSFVVGRYMCPKDVSLENVSSLTEFNSQYQPHNSAQLMRICANLGNEV